MQNTPQHMEISLGEISIEFHDAHSRLVARMRDVVVDTAKKMAKRGEPIEKFLDYCARQAAGNSATWGGGAHAATNVVEAIRLHAWITGAIDLSIRELFNQGN